MTTRLISLSDPDDGSDPLPPAAPLPVNAGSATAPSTRQHGGVLRFGDGTWIVITARTVVGREPWNDPAVVAGSAMGATIPGADGSVSRVHAEFAVTPTGFGLLDRGSLNGTHVRDPDASTWVSVPADRPHPLRHGSSVSFGGRTCRFEPLDDDPSHASAADS